MVFRYSKPIIFRAKRQLDNSILVTGVNGLNEQELSKFVCNEAQDIILIDDVYIKSMQYDVGDEFMLLGKANYSSHHCSLFANIRITKIRVLKNTHWRNLILHLRKEVSN